MKMTCVSTGWRANAKSTLFVLVRIAAEKGNPCSPVTLIPEMGTRMFRIQKGYHLTMRLMKHPPFVQLSPSLYPLTSKNYRSFEVVS